jgi:hypothetical protein
VKTAKSRLSGDPTDRDLATGSENDLSPGINFRYRRENPQAKESFRYISLTQQRNRLGFGAREPKRVSQRGAFHHFVKPFVMTWEFRSNRKICPAFEQQLCYRVPGISRPKLVARSWHNQAESGVTQGCGS